MAGAKRRKPAKQLKKPKKLEATKPLRKDGSGGGNIF
jgi:hypothetical protein